MHPMIPQVKSQFLALQKQLCEMLETEDGQAKFIQDPWQHAEGGGGLTCVLRDGLMIEQAGVNFSHVRGAKLPPTATALRPELAGASFEALGISVVIHPRSPYAPTSHFNIRMFFAQVKDQWIWWSGGGFDLTPYYGFEEDAVAWHRAAKTACDEFHPAYYPKFKKQCDEYFYLKHRQEARGIGGIFFDDFNELGLEPTLAFLMRVGQSYLEVYQAILSRRKAHAYGEAERSFQCYRRGRYVEFNLVYDRGTLFGLQSGGRTESILMSLPPVVHWSYQWKPAPGSWEERLYTEFLPPREWVS